MYFKKKHLSLLLGLAALILCVMADAQTNLNILSIVVEKLTSRPVLTFSKNSLALQVGEKASNAATSDQPNSKGAISYESSNNTLLKVTQAGEVEALAPGIGTISATQAADLPGFESAKNSYTVKIYTSLSASSAVATSTYAVGDSANVTPVIATGGTDNLTYSVSPGLPAGLSMNANTGAITGTANAAAAQATYTVTATDSASPAHTATATFALTINGALSATTAVATTTYAVGDTASVRPVTAAGGTGTLSYSVSPTLPAGLSLS
ncbi:putative Ig domain-containing protein, partial [Pseudomonas caspiana]|uniref:putative Ig domain-containing protein n=1 Tax=Pseudomonas caspiana TaxID=1451454 RepID=UPI0018735CF7